MESSPTRPASRPWFIIVVALVISCVGSIMYFQYEVIQPETSHSHHVLLQLHENKVNQEVGTSGESNTNAPTEQINTPKPTNFLRASEIPATTNVVSITSAPTTFASLPETTHPAPTTSIPTNPPTTVPDATTKRPVPAPSRDEKGGIHVVDPEGKKECVVLWTGHLVLEFMDTSYCYTKEERRTFLRELVYTLNDLLDEAGIEYWVDSGTLLGVYRNKGLIPHDIDADVGLTQAGFEKLRQTKLNVPENYEMFVSDSPHYRQGPFDFLPGRFADKRTGLYVDLFEFLPLQQTIQVPKNKTFKFEVAQGQANEYRNGNTSLLMHTDKNATVYMEMEVMEEVVIEQLAPVASVAWWACAKCPEYRHFIVPKDWIYPLQRCPFDGKEVWCPAKQKEYLVMLYGDNFMEPQNPNDR